MRIYDEQGIHRGAGAFEQAMRAQTSIPGRSGRMAPTIAIGILSAAMRSGLPASQVNHMIEEHFVSDASLLKNILNMYEGKDWQINLWNCLPSGQYKLCTDLCRPGMSQWRYDPSLQNGS